MEKTLEYYLSLDYAVEVHKISADLGGGYAATIPELGSQAFVGDGETPDEAYGNLMAAKTDLFEEYLRQGLTIPEPGDDQEDYSGKLVLRMPRELHARLARAAKENDTSLNQFIVYALSSFASRSDALAESRHKRRIA